MAYRPSTIRPIQSGINRVLRNIQKTVGPTIKAFADDSLAEFKKELGRQEFVSFAKYPLDPDYRQGKIKKNLDERTMFATGHYVKSIKVMKRTAGPLTEYAIGFEKDDVAIDPDTKEPTDLPLWKLALIHEYGTQALPPRAHWNPYLREMKRAFPAVYAKIRKAIWNDMKRI